MPSSPAPPHVLPSEVDVLVVGAGQAGLGTARALTHRPGLRVLVVDRAPVGSSWRDRWDSLVLFTPRRFTSLPGMRFPAGPTRTPDRLEMARYLEDYARRCALPVRTGVAVRRLSRCGDRLCADTSAGEIRAHHVVIATGPFSRPRVPAAAAGLSPDVAQLHSYDYRRASDLPAGDVLVVGGGNSAAQLAVELAATHRVTVAAPRAPLFLPVRVAGVDLYWWLRLTGVLDARSTSWVARLVQRRGDPVIGTGLRDLVRSGRVRLLASRVVAAEGREVRLADGSAVPVTCVLWCTGFRPDTAWLDLPGSTDADGAPVHVDGASPVPGLHWMGLPWQSRLNSSIVDGVAHDARVLAARVRRLSRAAGPGATSTRRTPRTAGRRRSAAPWRGSGRA